MRHDPMACGWASLKCPLPHALPERSEPTAKTPTPRSPPEPARPQDQTPPQEPTRSSETAPRQGTDEPAGGHRLAPEARYSVRFSPESLMISADEVAHVGCQGLRGPRGDCAENRNRPRHGLHPKHSPDFPGSPASGGTGSRMIGAVRASPGSLLASASEVTDISEIRFRYRICPGVRSWRAPTGDARGGPGTDFTASWPPVHAAAIRLSSHAVAARGS